MADTPARPEAGADELDDEQIWQGLDEQEKEGKQPDPTDIEPPAPEPEPEPEPEPAPTDTPPEPAEDVWKDAPEALRKAHEADVAKHEANFKRISGTVSGYQRKADRLEAENRKLREAAQPPAQPADDAAPADGDLLEDPEFKKAMDEYPEVMAPVAKVVGSLTRQLKAANDRAERLEGSIGNLSTAEQERIFDEQETALAQVHPDWKDVTATPDFLDWVAAQPRYVRDALERNGENIIDATEAADLISRYKAERQPNPSPPDGGEEPNPSEQKNHRAQQLESAAAPRGRGSGKVTTGVPEDATDQQVWDFYEEEDRRKQQAAS